MLDSKPFKLLKLYIQKKFLKYFDTLTYKKKECMFDLKGLP